MGSLRALFLGPVLYICYVNNFPNVGNVLTNMYANEKSGLYWANNLMNLRLSFLMLPIWLVNILYDIDFRAN